MELYTPDKDGVTHINVYSKAQTLTGRKLTNYAKSPFRDPLFGEFESMEGFWFWLSSGKQYNHLRKLSGFKAHHLGKIVCNENSFTMDEEKFKNYITIATKAKLRQNKDILQMLVETGDLPLVHYYYDYNEIDLSKAKVTYLKKHHWQMELLMEIREKTQIWMKKNRIVDVRNLNF